jgi:hypothetical protein
VTFHGIIFCHRCSGSARLAYFLICYGSGLFQPLRIVCYQTDNTKYVRTVYVHVPLDHKWKLLAFMKTFIISVLFLKVVL